MKVKVFNRQGQLVGPVEMARGVFVEVAHVYDVRVLRQFAPLHEERLAADLVGGEHAREVDRVFRRAVLRRVAELGLFEVVYGAAELQGHGDHVDAPVDARLAAGHQTVQIRPADEREPGAERADERLRVVSEICEREASLASARFDVIWLVAGILEPDTLATIDEFQISHFGAGPTEFRIALIVINTLIIRYGAERMADALPYVAGSGLVVLVILVYVTQRRVWATDMRARG